ncbi:MAG: DsbA family oxidoreductase [Saccharospirillaceae bacterium]|nr:DsbA family oxidoreductase [Pseudomonadales bacterium]NRB79074.1 DsbA family oxidoreductase [Saccharospirillaceae bacterium]
MSKKQIQLDIISDVMCPWCIVGYKQLLPALDQFKDEVDFVVNWQPFELNPNMPEKGQELREHLHEKYGSTDEESKQNRKRLEDIGKDLDFTFKFTDESKIVNSFSAHQLLTYAFEQGQKTNNKQLQTNVKLSLFKAHFSDARDVSDINVLIEVALENGLAKSEVSRILNNQTYAQNVRESQQKWMQNGINAVPAVVVNMKYLLSGAQPTQSYIDVINNVLKA